MSPGYLPAIVLHKRCGGYGTVLGKQLESQDKVSLGALLYESKLYKRWNKRPCI